ncbi:hypothetical protein GOODEAATRI_009009 [Goodea atripinnis]|uniref:Uncharacterized protein n=1 Tax=Goodea atripinnis TaxID=208336 RepID=A0ABV0PM51_9TELE
MLSVFTVIRFPAKLLHRCHQTPVAHNLQQAGLQRDAQPGDTQRRLGDVCSSEESYCGLVSGLIFFKAMMSSMVFSTLSGWTPRADCSSWDGQQDSGHEGKARAVKPNDGAFIYPTCCRTEDTYLILGLSPELVRFSDDLETEQILLLVIQVLWFQARIAGAVLGADGMTRSSPRCFTEPDPWMPAQCTASVWKSISKNQKPTHSTSLSDGLHPPSCRSNPVKPSGSYYLGLIS